MASNPDELVLAFCKACSTIYTFTRAQVPTAKCEPGPDGWKWNVRCPGCGGFLRRSSTHNHSPRKSLVAETLLAAHREGAQ